MGNGVEEQEFILDMEEQGNNKEGIGIEIVEYGPYFA
jgi:hypothetical protein